MKLAERVLDLARTKGLMVATVESCTGGMVAVALTDISGASDVMERGFVTYTNKAKIELVGVRESTLAKYGAVSEEVAAEMAQGALARAPVGLALSVTGIAGPGGTALKPEGRVCFGLASTSDMFTQTVEFGILGRIQVRLAARDYGLGLLLRGLQNSL